MGTRFMCTVEAPIHDNIKQAIVDAKETDTELLLRRWKNTSRLFKNKVTEEASKIERESTTGKFEEVGHLVSGKRGRQVFSSGDPDFGVCVAVDLIGVCDTDALLGLDGWASHWPDSRHSHLRRSC